ncbi:MAG TPA: hypothetical protein VM324_16020 [Egibacteraceae bacterium]|nr:hypothetical protein [Egibacteraceae bacterium]
MQGFFARAGARLSRFEARAQFGRNSPQWREAREHVRATKEVFRQRVAAAQGRIAGATRRIHTATGRLGRVRRFAGPIGVGANAYIALFAGSPYDGARETIDRIVAGATAVASAGVVAVAPVLLTAAGVVAIAGTVAGRHDRVGPVAAGRGAVRRRATGPACHPGVAGDAGQRGVGAAGPGRRRGRAVRDWPVRPDPARVRHGEVQAVPWWLVVAGAASLAVVWQAARPPRRD